MNKKRITLEEKKIKVKATKAMEFIRFVHFKGLTLSEYRALKNGAIVEVYKSTLELNKKYLEKVT